MVMDDATQKLVDEAHGWCPACGGSGMVMEFGPTDCPNLAVHRALEAAQRPSHVVTTAEGAVYACGCPVLEDHPPLILSPEQYAEQAAQRPPVSPEVREEVAWKLSSFLFTVYDHGTSPNAKAEADLILDFLARFSFPSQPVTRESLRLVVEGAIERWADLYPTPQVYDVLTDAILAQWPSQPVYDEESVERAAKAMQLHAGFEAQMWENQNHESREWWMSQARAALVAALRSGELTKEEDRG